jgi:hypothetical protein
VNKVPILQDLQRTLQLTIPFFDLEQRLLARSYAPGKWTAREILAHLVDSELVFQARARLILAEPNCAIVPFDQDRWAKTLAYPQRSLPLARRLYTSARESLIELVDLLPEPLFGREGRHPEHPSYRAWDVVAKAGTHNRHHYGQLLAIRDGTAWTPS